MRRESKPFLETKTVKGRMYHYYRVVVTVDGKRKEKRIRIKAEPGTAEFDREYWSIRSGKHAPSFANDPTIGSRPISSDADYYMLITAHEVAHHIQHAYGPKIARFRLNYRKPHGDCFKAIYRYLRRDLINPSLEGRSKLMAAGR